MCHQIKILAKNVYGTFSFCEDCNVYHINFTNFYIELNKEDLEIFKKHILEIDVDYLECKYNSIPLKRKIVVLTTQKNISLLFDKTEFNAFKDLVFYNQAKINKSLSVFDIDYTLLLN